MAEPQEVIVLQCGQPTSVSIVNGNIVVTVFDRYVRFCLSFDWLRDHRLHATSRLPFFRRKSITLVNLLGGGTEGDSLKTYGCLVLCSHVGVLASCSLLPVSIWTTF